MENRSRAPASKCLGYIISILNLRGKNAAYDCIPSQEAYTAEQKKMQYFVYDLPPDSYNFAWQSCAVMDTSARFPLAISFTLVETIAR